MSNRRGPIVHLAYPAKGPVVEVQKSVLLLQTEPRLVSGVLLHQLGALVSVVELVRSSIGHPALGQNEDIVAALGAEGIGVNGNGLQVDIGVVARGLAGGGTVEVPLRGGRNVSIFNRFLGSLGLVERTVGRSEGL